jgi:PAS domain S-box-containing protein
MKKELDDYKYALDESAIVAITNPKGIIIHANDNFCKISKYSREELIGKDHRIINSGFHSKEFIRDLWVTIASGKIWKGEIKNRAKDGTYYWVDTTIVPFLNEERKPIQYVAIRADITQRKKAEEDLIKYASALEYNNSQLVDFCNIVSNNLRAPLLNISMLVDYIDQSDDENERQMVHDKIKPVVNHLMDVFNELVESIQVQRDAGIEVDKINLKGCLDKVLIGFETQIKEYDADIELDDTEAPIIYFPYKYLESIIANLVSNTLKYKSPECKPIIKIKSRKVNDAVLLSVSDNGLGIDLDLHRNNLFKIRKTFHRHPDAKGFGLFMIKTQIEAMGGKIWVESKPNKGSTFFVEFNNQNL